MPEIGEIDLKESSLSRLSHWSFYPWLIWSLGATFFFAEYFVHVSLSVMVPQLMQAFHVGALLLGSLSALFWYPYMVMQIPVGALVDRFGPHKLLAFASGLCAASCFAFAGAQYLWVAEVARFLIGFTSSFAFVSTLKLAKIWFPASRFGFLAGLTQAVGMLGAVVGEGPVSASVSAFGWRNTVWGMGGFLVVLAILILLLIREHPQGHASEECQVQSARALWDGFMTVMKNPQTWINGLFVGLLFAPTSAFGELWGVSYLVGTYHVSQAIAANAIGFVFIGWAVGGPLAGLLSDYLKRRKIVMFLSAVSSLVTLSVALYVPLPLPVLFVVLFLYGVSNTGVGVSYALSSEINHNAVAGISMAFANMASVIIGAFCQPLIGWLLELHWDHKIVNHVPIYSEYAYQASMTPLLICFGLAILVVLFIKETRCLPIESRDK